MSIPPDPHEKVAKVLRVGLETGPFKELFIHGAKLYDRPFLEMEVAEYLAQVLDIFYEHVPKPR